MLVGVPRPVAAVDESVVKAPVEAVVAPTDVLLIVPPLIDGLEIDGDVARTGLPEPVAEFARPDATPAPRPLTPVAIGNPVALVSVAADGVPRFGVVRVGEFDKTTEPVPVDVVAPVPPLAAVSGVCNVSVLKVGDGYVWASAAIGTRSAAMRSFFIDFYEMETTPPLFQTTPGVAGSVVGRLVAQEMGEDVDRIEANIERGMEQTA
ncbi:hypothetical protein [Paraburkholderia phenoliruptrix]|uniref:hypothetical protein n=1 Tax=Paraburkholderia phenoliruptrix TaxID=252970 RepID=UPI0028601CCA|nr:hypothetical protein [Paraburkholderia phenoliruptrix]MDR6389244.1 hypothetical protein [Paraburkholderia phenoliruptrix]